MFFCWRKALDFITVIITSYNQTPTLELLLSSLEHQTFKNFEVILADDGSSDGVENLSREPRGFPLRLVTQPDEGYRKAKILNQAVRVARGDYLVFLDGDVFLDRYFLEDHRALRVPRHFICGRRVDLGPVFSKGLNAKATAPGEFSFLGLIWSALCRDSSGFKRCIRIPNRRLRKWLGYDRPIDLLGSNFSLWKQDLINVNGFNENFESYWGEDGDLFVRLKNSGNTSIGAKGVCIQYHLFHPRRPPTQAHIEHYQKALQDTEYKWAKKGLV